jgi:hypothetical protein
MGAQRIIIILMLLILGIFAGCGSSGDSGPTLPSPGGTQGGDFEGDQDEPPIPTPYAEIRDKFICDMEWELDGDLVVSTPTTIYLYTPYGVLKRTYPIQCVHGLTNNDTGRGMSFYGRGSCNPNGIDDDIYVSEGHYTTVFNDDWYKGDPNHPDMPPGSCDETITMQWACPETEDLSPFGYSYHPYSGRTYLKINSGGVWIGDDDCEDRGDWHPDIGATVDRCDVDDVILSYDQDAPFPPPIHDFWYTGPPRPEWPNAYGEPMDPAGDWLMYTTLGASNCIQQLAALGFAGYQRMANTTLVFSANGTDPPG